MLWFSFSSFSCQTHFKNFPHPPFNPLGSMPLQMYKITRILASGITEVLLQNIQLYSLTVRNVLEQQHFFQLEVKKKISKLLKAAFIRIVFWFSFNIIYSIYYLTWLLFYRSNYFSLFNRKMLLLSTYDSIISFSVCGEGFCYLV